jgi:hypothetical protein
MYMQLDEDLGIHNKADNARIRYWISCWKVAATIMMDDNPTKSQAGLDVQKRVCFEAVGKPSECREGSGAYLARCWK